RERRRRLHLHRAGRAARSLQHQPDRSGRGRRRAIGRERVVEHRAVPAAAMNRRGFIRGATGLVAATSLDPLIAHMAAPPPVKSIRTPVLEIAYHETGDASGIPVILLHGFPDDAHAYDGVAPLIAKAGCRAFAVYLRGYAPTTFLDPAAARTAEQAA